MDKVLEKFELFQKAAQTLLAGGKIDPRDYPAGFADSLYTLLTRMHAGFFVTAEPQCYIKRPEHAHIDPVYMGQTDIHPVTDALDREAEYIKAVAAQVAPLGITQPEIMGLDWSKRAARKRGDTPPFDLDKIPTLTPAGIEALYECATLIVQRLKRPTITFQQPIIIQDPTFWKEFIGDVHDNKAARNHLESRNIFITHDAVETARTLAATPYGAKISPRKMEFKRSDEQTMTHAVFTMATSDQIKLGQNIKALEESGLAGEIHQQTNIIGPYQIPEEKTYSYEGNAYTKMVELVKRLAVIGRQNVTQFYANHELHNLDAVRLVTNDGGLGKMLENAKGERFTALFNDPDYFADTYKEMNPMQAGPGVELANFKKTMGLPYGIAQMFAKVRDVCAQNPAFEERDLRAYDTAIQMSLPLTTALDALDAGKSAEEIVHDHAIAVASLQRLKVSEFPLYRDNKPVEVTQTEHYLLVPDQSLTRDQMPDWFLDGPNGTSLRLLQKYTGATTVRAQMEPDLRTKIRMGMLAMPEALWARGPTENSRNIGSLLAAFGIVTRQGPDYWKRFKLDTEAVLGQARNAGISNSMHGSDIRHLLDKASVLYIGSENVTSRIANPHDRKTADLKLGLAFQSAMVRNQVLNPMPIVVHEDGPAHKWLELVTYKQQMGLVGQKMEHLCTVIPRDSDVPDIMAADKIACIARKAKKVTGIERRFHANDVVETDHCMVAVAYCSASNRNETWVRQTERYGFLCAVNGFSLKVGGGNDGLMKAVADGFMRGKEEVKRKGYNFPNQLILIQCEDTKAIEGEYEGHHGAVSRSHLHIEPRRADLQNGDFKTFLAGGIGTDEEGTDELLSRHTGLINPHESPMYLLNQYLQTPSGVMGVYDLYPEIYGQDFLKKMNVKTVLTAEEIIVKESLRRFKMQVQETHALTLFSLRDHMREAGSPAALAQRVKWFRPPYDVYTGAEGDLPQNSQSLVTNQECKFVRNVA